MQFGARFGDGTRLARMQEDQARAREGKGALLGKLRVKKAPLASQPRPPVVETGETRKPPRSEKPRVSVPELPLSSASAPNVRIRATQATRSLVDCIARSAIDQVDRVFLSWPERVHSPLSAALLAALELHESHPGAPWTLALHPQTARAKFEARRLFIDEKQLDARAMQRIKLLDKAKWIGPTYCYDYLLHGTASAQIRPRRASQTQAPITSPNLFEVVPVFEPSEMAARCPYGSSAANFLADIEAKKELLRIAPAGAECASTLDGAPAALFLLPEEQTLFDRCLAFTRRLRLRTDVVVIDLSRSVTWEAASTLSRLRKLKTVFGRTGVGRPAFVVICNDAFLAQRCRELLADVQRDRPAKNSSAPRRRTSDLAAELDPDSLVVAVKTRPCDFSDSDDLTPGSDVPCVRVHPKNAGMAEFRRKWSIRARELDLLGRPEAALAIRKGIAFSARIASAPVGYKFLIESIEAAEEERGLNPWLTSPFKLTTIASDLDKAAEAADGHAGEIKELRKAILREATRCGQTTELHECVRDLLEKASRKSNRTVVMAQGELMSDALREYVFTGGIAGLDVGRLRRKVIFSTARTIEFDLARVGEAGARVDTGIVLQPSIRGIQRLLMLPRLPDEVILVGDAVALAQVRHHLRQVRDILPALAGRAKSFCDALDRAADQSWDDSLSEDAVSLPLSGATTLDFSGPDGAGGDEAGPCIVVTTASGYHLRYRAKGDCLVRQDDRLSPFRLAQAGKLEPGDDVLIMTGHLQERLNHLLGTIEVGDGTFLKVYREHVQERAAALPGTSPRAKASALLAQMRTIAARRGETVVGLFGKNEVSNVSRWLSASVADGTRQPRAPRHQRAFAYFTEALGIDGVVAAQFWKNSILRTRTENVLAGAREAARAFGFLVNPHKFYAAHPTIRNELKALMEEMTRSFDEVVACRIERDPR